MARSQSHQKTQVYKAKIQTEIKELYEVEIMELHKVDLSVAIKYLWVTMPINTD